MPTSVGKSGSAAFSNTCPRASNCTELESIVSSKNPSIWEESSESFSLRADSQASLRYATNKDKVRSTSQWTQMSKSKNFKELYESLDREPFQTSKSHFKVCNSHERMLDSCSHSWYLAFASSCHISSTM